ncbi:MAG: translocation/assembly module TamB domain-containing protein [Myxococcota bacterium]|nr:translocation/assembly module TamB domain-containing protein [Myxococcota bacterium]
MTTSHTQGPSGTDARPSHPPGLRRKRERRDLVRLSARALCVALAMFGSLPFAAALIVRSTWAQSWAARETTRLMAKQGIVASYRIALRVWPLAVELRQVRVEASASGPPVLLSDRVRVRPKLFALLAGKLIIDQIELDQPRIHAVMRDGKLVNLVLPRSGAAKTTGPMRSPFNSFAVTDGSIDLDFDDIHVEARAVDLDATAEEDALAGASYEMALRAGRTSVLRRSRRPDGSMATDDDALCSVEGRVRIEPQAILVRRLEGVGSADLDVAPGTMPACNLPASDKHRVELSLGHLHVGLPHGQIAVVAFDGHVRARGPIALAERAALLPETDGWIGIDADVRYGPESVLPEVSGTIEAHDVRLGQYAFAEELRSELTVRRDVVRSPRTTIRLANGTVVLSDTMVEPLAKGIRLESTHLDASNVDFTALLRALGVHPSSWVAWDLRELHGPILSGTLAPLKIDGDMTAKTYAFGVYDRPAEDRGRERLFGFSEAQIAAHIAVRPDALRFVDLRATLPRSHIDGGFVSIGFDNELRVDVPHFSADLDDVSPIGPVVMHGRVEAAAHVTGVFNKPEPMGDIKSIAGFTGADVAFGDVTGGHVNVDVQQPQVEISGLRAKRRDSAYEVPTAKLRFGGARGFVVDAVGSSAGLGLRDLLSMFALDDDPRFDGLDATIATRADVHVALGGPEDACGGGYVGVTTRGHLSNVSAYGERFAQGDADIALRWYDRQQGIAGAELDVRSFVLDKVQPPVGRRAAATGTVLGSVSMRRGGALSANVMIERVPVSRLDLLGHLAQQIDGSLSGVAHVTGNLDDFRPDAGFVARAELDLAGLRVREVALPSSHLALKMTQRLAQVKRSVGRSRCGAPLGPPFNRAVYLSDTASHGEWTVDGDLVGGTVQLHDIVVTRAKSPRLSGRVSFRGVDLGPLARVLLPRRSDADDPGTGAPASAIGGQLWAELIVDEIALDQPGRSRVRAFLGPVVVTRGGERMALQPPRDPLTLDGDAVVIPPLQLALSTADGFRGGFVLTGGMSKMTTDPTLALQARLDPMDLAVVQRVVPAVVRASGKVEGTLRVTGKAAAPSLSGELHAAGDAIEFRGLPSAITNVRLDVRASASEVTATGGGELAGGTITLEGSVPLRGLQVGALDSRVALRGIHVTPADGVAATFDADLGVAYDRATRSGDGPALPHVTGEVRIASLAYTRPISLATDLSVLGAKAKRTEVDTYDPAADFVALDLRVRTTAPMLIKNNLIELQLAIDSGSLDVTGTNQRVGLRGVLRTLPGGRFHFQQSDFEVRQGLIRFADPTRIAPNVDITAVTEYRRYTDTSAGAAAGAGAGGGVAAASTGSTRGGSLWRIGLHAYGDADNLRVDMTSEPSLSQEDIVLLLAVGMTRAELDQLQASSLGASIALNYLGAASGADRALKQALPIIDDFRFGSAYSTATGKTEPQLTVGKRLTNDVRASVTAGLAEDRQLRSNIEWRLNNHLSVQGSYDNVNAASSSTLGNLGVDLRWRLEFE